MGLVGSHRAPVGLLEPLLEPQVALEQSYARGAWSLCFGAPVGWRLLGTAYSWLEDGPLVALKVRLYHLLGRYRTIYLRNPGLHHQVVGELALEL